MAIDIQSHNSVTTRIPSALTVRRQPSALAAMAAPRSMMLRRRRPLFSLSGIYVLGAEN